MSSSKPISTYLPRIVPTAVLLAIACGPPRVPPADGGETGDEESTTEPTPDPDLPDDDPPETESETETETGDFVIEPDTLPASCDSFEQDCPPGEKCVPYASGGDLWDANKCVPVLGDQAVGEPCKYDGLAEATDDCDADSICWGFAELVPDTDLVGTCHALCSGSLEAPECPPASECLISGSSVISLCMPYCDPLASECGEGLACFWTGGQFGCVPAAERPVAIGEPCSYINDCMPGSACIDATDLPACEGIGCCTPFCDVMLGARQCDAVPGTECVAFFPPNNAPPGFDHVGLCVSP